MPRRFISSFTERFVVNELVRGVSPVSMACWFNADNASSNDYTMLQLTDQSTADNYFRLGFAGARGQSDFREIMAFVGGSADADAALTPATVLNEWHHALAVFPDVDSRSAYLDGVQAETVTTVTHPTGIDAMDIGYQGDSTPGDPWSGGMADVAVWDIALTTADAAMLAAGVSPLLIKPANLIFYSPLWLKSGDERDLIGGKTLVDTNTVGFFSTHPRLYRIGPQSLVVPRISQFGASGTPTIPAVTASGTAKVRKTASGAATLAAIVAAGTVALTHNCSGAAEIPPVEASGMATVNATLIAVGDATIPAIEAAGTAEITRNANGAATIPAIESAGTSIVHREASGGGTIAPVEATGAAAIIKSASGGGTIAPIEAAGTANVVNSASGAASIPAIAASGTATIMHSASGAATLPPIEGAGTAGMPIKTASGNPVLAAAVASGVAQISIPAVEYKSVTAALGGDPGADTLAVPSVPGGTDQLYLVHVNLYTNGGSAGSSEVASVTGGGLTFALIPGTVACSGRISQPRMETWWAFGSPSSFTCTVTLDNATADFGFHVAVSCIENAANQVPSNADYSNINGDSGGPACSGGTDNDLATLDMTVSNDDSLIVNQLHPRNTDMNTADADYTEEYFVEQTDGGTSSTMGIYTRSEPPIGVDEIQHLIGSDKPWSMIGLEIEKAAAPIFSAGDATIPAIIASGTAVLPKTASGAPGIPAIEASGAATVHRAASGTPSIPAVEAAGTADVVPIKTASGAPSIPAIEASGTATAHKSASGAAAISPVESAGSAAVINSASGAATIPTIEASGTASVVNTASGAASIPPIEASGTATVAVMASGAATIPAIEAAGTAEIVRNASGAASITPIEAAGTASVTNAASGDASTPPVEASGTVELIRNASGAATLAAVEASGMATVQAQIIAVGDATIPPIEASGAATVIRNASGAATTPPVEAAGTASVINTASGAASIPPIEAAGTASVSNVASGAATTPPIEAAGTATIIRSASGAASTPPIEAAGTASVVNTASGAATIPPIEAAGTATVANVASGAATIPAIQAAGTATSGQTASGAATIPAIEAAGTASLPMLHSAAGDATLTPIEASGNAAINAVPIASRIEIIGRSIIQRIEGRT